MEALLVNLAMPTGYHGSDRQIYRTGSKRLLSLKSNLSRSLAAAPAPIVIQVTATLLTMAMAWCPLQILLRDNPLTRPGLTLAQSLLFWEAAAQYFLAVPTVMMSALPIIYIFTGVSGRARVSCCAGSACLHPVSASHTGCSAPFSGICTNKISARFQALQSLPTIDRRWRHHLGLFSDLSGTRAASIPVLQTMQCVRCMWWCVDVDVFAKPPWRMVKADSFKANFVEPGSCVCV